MRQEIERKIEQVDSQLNETYWSEAERANLVERKRLLTDILDAIDKYVAFTTKVN